MLPEGVAHVIGTLPYSCRLRSLEAEAVALAWLYEHVDNIDDEGVLWLKRYVRMHAARQLVLRSLLVSKEAYLRHLESVTGWDGTVASEDFVSNLGGVVEVPDVWLIEISVQELYPTNKRKLGEILVNCSLSYDDIDASGGAEKAVLAVRLPGTWSDGGGRFLPSPITSHTELFDCEQGSPDRDVTSG